MFAWLQKATEEEAFIGEVYAYKYKDFCWGVFTPHNTEHGSYGQWMKFKRSDRNIYQDHDGYLSVFGKCFRQEDVMFYDKVAFGAAREKIERKYNGQKNN